VPRRSNTLRLATLWTAIETSADTCSSAQALKFYFTGSPSLLLPPPRSTKQAPPPQLPTQVETRTLSLPFHSFPFASPLSLSDNANRHYRRLVTLVAVRCFILITVVLLLVIWLIILHSNSSSRFLLSILCYDNARPPSPPYPHQTNLDLDCRYSESTCM
jgi:hypothetical protein